MTELIALAEVGLSGDPIEAEGLGTDEVDLPVDLVEVLVEVLESGRATGPVLMVELPARQMGTVTPSETGGAPGAPAGWRQDGGERV